MQSLLLEIGTEEIPAGYIEPALTALAADLVRKLGHARIEHGAVTTCGTPRRLAVIIADVAPRQRSLTETVTGPPERVALDDQGNWTMAARKFAEKVGMPVERLTVADTPKGRYLCGRLVDKGTTTASVLRQLLPDAIFNTPFPKTMRWSDLSIAFARPIQSVVALLGQRVIGFTLGGAIKCGRHTRGHLFMHPKRVKINDATSYHETLRGASVIVDIAERRHMVQVRIDQAAAELGGTIVADEALVDTVTHLVEAPFATGGRFDDVFLELPREILITSMREHQKYFAVTDADGRLMPCFVAVNNTATKDMALVARGHERVLRARLSDARFFYRSDLQQPMENWNEKLKGVLFQAKLGTMHAKSQRIEEMAGWLADVAGPEFKTDLLQAARLCKADLVSQVVYEFPNLQGIMGRVYAAAAGAPEAVAAAIEEHYRPTYSGGPLPQHRTGALLAVADKLDTICGCFSVGLTPTGASDPYALRRLGIGIVQIMLAQQLTFSLRAAIEQAMQPFAGDTTGTAAAEAVYGFLQQRIAHLLAEQGHYDKDLVAAVVTVSVDHIPNVWQRAAALQALKGAPDFEPLAVAFKRAVNILRKAESLPDRSPAPTLFTESAEQALYDACGQVKGQVEAHLAAGRPDDALRIIATLREPVDRFFDEVMVMDEDPRLRDNRLALLQAIADLFGRIADFSKIAT
ncbi:glycine--tRNA ligase subunit beta [Desulfatitalea alkaliphila]|uniref:Glycine--tRNA ligase beta subunit n=1 Tax=Desulfatitalea alkaliphila TaxID=2929485 RepID=A0AA41UHT6_9BACT|nr:glycine--tRNA ligase subunit beta [Desulfatitalea alkaliphila]MCJ8499980.1 glycine--tRNA ligase subunit beta [Desulfatitalea alkaliphila]